MSSDLLYSLGLDISGFKTSAKASKEAADDIKQGFKGFKDVLAAGGVTTAVLGFFSQVVDYAQQSKGKLDENTAAVKRFGDAIDANKKEVLGWGTQVLGFLNRAGEGWGLFFRGIIEGFDTVKKANQEEMKTTAEAAAAREALNAQQTRLTAIIAQKKKLQEEFNSIADEGLTKQEKANFLAETARAENEKLHELKKGTIEYQEQELRVIQASNTWLKARHDLDKEQAADAKKAAEAEEKALDQSIKDYNKLGDIKQKQLDYELSKAPLEEQSAELTRQKLDLEARLLNTALSITDETELRTRYIDVDRNLTDVTLKLTEQRLAAEKGITAEKKVQTNLITTDGTDTQTLSDRQLAELLTKTQQQLSAASQSTPNYPGSDNGAGFIQNRVRQIQDEIYDRKRFRQSYQMQGEGAFKNYAADDENRYRRYITPEDEQRQKDQAKNIADVTNIIRNVFGG